jgi:hypothetical protein
MFPPDGSRNPPLPGPGQETETDRFERISSIDMKLYHEHAKDARISRISAEVILQRKNGRNMEMFIFFLQLRRII